VSRIVGIDPGINGCGIAILKDGTLWDARYAESVLNPAFPTHSRVVATAMAAWEHVALARDTHVVVERPQIYPDRPVPSEDVLVLMAVVGALGAMAEEHCIPWSWVLPREWKKQVPKEIKLRRIENALTTVERARIQEDRKTRRHNVLDAIGIAKWFHSNRDSL
jgi:hypothetical protein